MKTISVRRVGRAHRSWVGVLLCLSVLAFAILAGGGSSVRATDLGDSPAPLPKPRNDASPTATPSASSGSGATSGMPTRRPPTIATPTAAVPTAVPTATVASPTSRPTTTAITLGAWTGQPWEPEKINTFVQAVGAPAALQWYQDWVHGGFYAPYFDAIAARGAMPILTWEPNDYTITGVSQPQFALATIASGAHDPFIRQFAKSAAAWGKPFYLRFGHEMNGDWYPWAVGVNGNTSEQYVAAWRHIVDIFRQERATNVRWVWSPNVTYYGAKPFAPMFPGNDYVDYVGLDGYNFGTIQPWASWKEFRTVFEASYDALGSLTSKPVMISEFASVEPGGDKAAWITRALLTDIPARFPRVQAMIWFNSTEYMNTDWRVNSSPAALTAYRTALASPLYRGRLP